MNAELGVEGSDFWVARKCRSRAIRFGGVFLGSNCLIFLGIGARFSCQVLLLRRMSQQLAVRPEGANH